MNEPTIKEFVEIVARMEARVEVLNSTLQEQINHNANMFRLNSELRQLIENDVAEAFERIKNIELKFFSELATDIVRLNGIVGEGNGRAWNPLDKRQQ